MKRTFFLFTLFFVVFLFGTPSIVEAASISISASPSSWWDKADGVKQVATITRTGTKSAFLLCLKDNFTNNSILLKSQGASANNNSTVNIDVLDSVLPSASSTNTLIVVSGVSSCNYGSAIPTFYADIKNIKVFSGITIDEPISTSSWNIFARDISGNYTTQNIKINRNDVSDTLQVCIKSTVANPPPPVHLGAIDISNLDGSVNVNLFNFGSSLAKGSYKLIFKAVGADNGNCDSSPQGFYKESDTFSIVERKVDVQTFSPDSWNFIDGLPKTISVARTDLNNKALYIFASSTDVCSRIGSITASSNNGTITDSSINTLSSGNYKIVVSTDTNCSKISNSITRSVAKKSLDPSSADFQVSKNIEIYSSLFLEDNSQNWNKSDNINQNFSIKKTHYTGPVLVCMKKGTVYSKLADFSATASSPDPFTVNASIFDKNTSPNISTLATGNYSMIALATSDLNNCKQSVASTTIPISIIDIPPVITVSKPSSSWNTLDGISANQVVTITKTEIYSDVLVCLQSEVGGFNKPLGNGAKIASTTSARTLEVLDIDSTLVSISQSGSYKLFATTGNSCNDTSSSFITGTSAPFNVIVPKLTIGTNNNFWDKNDTAIQTVSITRENYSSGALSVCLAKVGDESNSDPAKYIVLGSTTNTGTTFSIDDATLSTKVSDYGDYKIIVTRHPSNCSPLDSFIRGVSTASIKIFSSFSIVEPIDDWNRLDEVKQVVSVLRNDTDSSGTAKQLKVCLVSTSGPVTYYNLGDNVSLLTYPINKDYKIVVTTGSDCATPASSSVTRKVSTNSFTLIAQEFSVTPTGENGVPSPLTDWDKADNQNQLLVIKRAGTKAALKVCAQSFSEDLDENGVLVNNEIYNIIKTIPAVTTPTKTSTTTITDSIISTLSNGNHKITVTTATGNDPTVVCKDSKSDANVIWTDTSINIRESLNVVTPVYWNKKDGINQEVKIIRGDAPLTPNNAYMGNVLVCALTGSKYVKLGVIEGNNKITLSDADITTGSYKLADGKYSLVAFEIEGDPGTTSKCPYPNAKAVVKSNSFIVTGENPSLKVTANPSTLWNISNENSQTIIVDRSYVVGNLSVCLYKGSNYVGTFSKKIIADADESGLSEETFEISDLDLKTLIPAGTIKTKYTLRVSNKESNCVDNTAVFAETKVDIVDSRIDISSQPSNWNIADGIDQNISLERTNASGTMFLCLKKDDENSTGYIQFPDVTSESLSRADRDLSSITPDSYKLFVTTNPLAGTGRGKLGCDFFSSSDWLNNEDYANAVYPVDIISVLPAEVSINPLKYWNKSDGLPQSIKIDRKNKYDNTKFDLPLKICLRKIGDTNFYDLTSTGGFSGDIFDVPDINLAPVPPSGTGEYEVFINAGPTCFGLPAVSSSSFSLVDILSALSLELSPKDSWNKKDPRSVSVYLKRIENTKPVYLFSKLGSNQCKLIGNISPNSSSVTFSGSNLLAMFPESGIRSTYKIIANTSNDINKCMQATPPETLRTEVNIDVGESNLGFESGGMDNDFTNDLSGWAWSSDIGFISFNSKDQPVNTIKYGVDAAETPDGNGWILKGYAWSPNVGWLKFGPQAEYGSGEDTKLASCKNAMGIIYSNPWTNTQGTISDATLCQTVMPSKTGSQSLPVYGWARFLYTIGGDVSNSLLALDYSRPDVQISYDPVSQQFSGWAKSVDAPGYISFNNNIFPGEMAYAVLGPQFLLNAPQNVEVRESTCDSVGPVNSISFSPVVGATKYFLYTKNGSCTPDFKTLLVDDDQYCTKPTCIVSGGTLITHRANNNQDYCYGVVAANNSGEKSLLSTTSYIGPRNADDCGISLAGIEIASFVAKPSIVNKSDDETAFTECKFEWRVKDGGEALNSDSKCQITENGRTIKFADSFGDFTDPANRSGSYTRRLYSSNGNSLTNEMFCWQADSPENTSHAKATCQFNPNFKEVK